MSGDIDLEHVELHPSVEEQITGWKKILENSYGIEPVLTAKIAPFGESLVLMVTAANLHDENEPESEENPPRRLISREDWRIAV